MKKNYAGAEIKVHGSLFAAILRMVVAGAQCPELVLSRDMLKI